LSATYSDRRGRREKVVELMVVVKGRISYKAPIQKGVNFIGRDCFFTPDALYTRGYRQAYFSTLSPILPATRWAMFGAPILDVGRREVAIVVYAPRSSG
jgi:hypothetical protein